MVWYGVLVGAGFAREEVSQPRGTLRVGEPATEWEVKDWWHSQPLSLNDLKGKVVMVRFWTGPHCSYCAASAPALNEFYHLYHDRGLAVIGFYHHKSREPLAKQGVEQLIQRFGFQFPVAIDYEWKTLRRWWLQGKEKDWTSASFLIDRRGIVRYIHPGGAYVKGDPDYAVLQRTIEQLLGEQ